MEEMIDGNIKLFGLDERNGEVTAYADCECCTQRHKELSHKARVLVDAVFQLSRVIQPAERAWFDELRERSSASQEWPESLATCVAVENI